MLNLPENPTEEQIRALIAGDPVIWLETLCEMEGEPLQLEPYQQRVLHDESAFRIVNKGRQIGLSTVIAAEGLYNACTQPRYRASYISINKDEASDKINIARNLYHSIPDEFKTGADDDLKPRLWNDSEYEISFHLPPYTSELHSQPASSAIRGGKKDIYFDEFAHVRDDKKLYQAALPAITRGNRRMTIVSTPLGLSGLFAEIFTDEVNFSEYSRHNIPWWESKAMVRDGWYSEALALAEGLDTEARVFKYGTPKIIAIYKSFGGDLSSFQTEYEAVFVDETTSYYPWSLIIQNIDDDECPIWKGIPPGWEPIGRISIGVDLAKERDETVFTVVEHREQGDEMHRYVRHIYSTQSDYADQLDSLITLAKRTKASRVTIDQTGVGQMFVERARARFKEMPGCLVEGVVFTNQKKEQWATRFKGDLQLNTVHLQRHPMLTRQVHGIRRTKTESNFYKFSGPRDDHFWSLVLGMYGEQRTVSRISILGAGR
jgi:phage FluMu gp28-like protein